MTGPAAGWLALALVPFTAVLGWVSRRYVKRAFAARMRVHYAFGYAALGIATIHVFTSTSSMRGTSSAGIWLATLALLGLGWQALLGSNLQSPGSYRVTLRGWHVATFVAVLAFGFAHAMLNGPYSSMFGASQFSRGIGHRTVVDDPIRLPLGVAQSRDRVLQEATLALHAMVGVSRRKITGTAALASVAEEPPEPAFLALDFARAIHHKLQRLVASQLPQQDERGLQSGVVRLIVAHHDAQQLPKARVSRGR